MKAEIILSSNLPSKTCFVMIFFSKIANSNAKFLKKILWDPQIFFSSLIINTKNENYVKVSHT